MCLTSSPWDFQGLRVQGLTLGDVEVLTLTCYYPGEGGEGLGMITVQSCSASSLCSYRPCAHDANMARTSAHDIVEDCSMECPCFHELMGGLFLGAMHSASLGSPPTFLELYTVQLQTS